MQMKLFSEMVKTLQGHSGSSREINKIVACASTLQFLLVSTEVREVLGCTLGIPRGQEKCSDLLVLPSSGSLPLYRKY